MLTLFIKNNLLFVSGMIFGSIIGTLTTVAITVGIYGLADTLAIYNQSICGG